MIRDQKGYLFKDREVSWLHFNERVLQQAENKDTPLMERIRFLAIFSSNLDEFFRVRIAQIRRLQKINGRQPISEWQSSPDEILAEVQRTVVMLQERFTDIYEKDILPELAKRNIFLINEAHLDLDKKRVVLDYFKTQVFSTLFPVVLDDLKQIPHLRDQSIYLAVRMSRIDNALPPQHALIEVPPSVSRFFLLPKTDQNTYIMMLEDIIGANLHYIFNIFDYDHYESHIIKLTRDAELTIDKDDDFSMRFLDKIQKSLKQRSKGSPTRFVYEETMPKPMLELLIRKLGLKNVNLIPGGRYHNFKDFMNFPRVGGPEDYYRPMVPVPVREIDQARTVFEAINQKDILLLHPFNSFDYLIRMLREAALDPKVTAIKITLYRVAKNSNVVNALINAIKNGKKVFVLMELQARFDEEANIHWTNQLQEAGAQVHFGKQGQKVHCKMCLIYRTEDGVSTKYAHLSTGNYNGVTSRIYSDFCLFTRHREIMDEMEMLMNTLFSNSKEGTYKHLLVAPQSMKKRFLALIDTEITNAASGREAFIIAKMNSLVDVDIIKKLYDASRAGVRIKLIVRGICCLVPGVKGLSENITAISIIDRFLEHARVYIFCNNGQHKVYLSSADLMTRNLQNRVECAFPVYDESVIEKIMAVINLQLTDNVSARAIDGTNDTTYVKPSNGLRIRAQSDTYSYLRNRYAEATHLAPAPGIQKII
jgi:polyphosphate kinase